MKFNLSKLKSFQYKKEFLYKYFLLLSLFILIIIFAFICIFQYNYVANLVLIGLVGLFIILLFWEYNKLLFKNIFIIDKKIQESNKIYPFFILQNEKGKKVKFADSVSDMIDNFRLSLEQEYSSEILQQQAILDSLQNKINPHFLYNTLDSIRGKALEEGSRITAHMIEKLAVFFRYTISQSNNIVSLEQELQNVRNYIEIQQYRFNNRFTVETIVDEDNDQIMRYRVPKLILQPIIENAINHGLESLPKGNITIRIETTQSRLVINISDNGVGIEPVKLRELNERLQNKLQNSENLTYKGTGIALNNVNSRIKLKYGDKYGLVAYSTQGVGTQIVITLPLNQENYEN